MADLLDALHFMFEEDMAPTCQASSTRLGRRTRKTSTLRCTGPSYEWAVKTGDGSAGRSAITPYGRDTDASGQALPSLPDAPTELEHKEYIPPTPVDARKAEAFR